MRKRPRQTGAGARTLAYASAFVMLLSAARPASAGIYFIQKSCESKKYSAIAGSPPPSESIIRTWADEGKLRQDHGNPPSFIEIVRLDRRPGELISYLINLGTGNFGNTYWTFCRPFTPPSRQAGPEHRETTDATVQENVSAGSTGLRDALEAVDTGDTRIINNFRCRKYLLKGRLSSTEFSSEIWTSVDVASALERFGLTWGVRIERSDSRLRFRGDAGGAPEEMRTVKGFPVLITEIEQNRYVHYERKLELLELKEEDAPPNHFDLPEGLTKKYRGAMAHPPVCDD